MNDLAGKPNGTQAESLPDALGFELIHSGKGCVKGKFTIGKKHFSPHGYLHAASMVALADTAAGYGCLASLPEGASGFVTSELKANFIGSVQAGVVACEARLVHGGRTTQVWDAEVIEESSGKRLALFRCTQVLLYPR
jgi:1,4-dihydroxy-2-naphthoyl-CoA hydrolase